MDIVDQNGNAVNYSIATNTVRVVTAEGRAFVFALPVETPGEAPIPSASPDRPTPLPAEAPPAPDEGRNP